MEIDMTQAKDNLQQQFAQGPQVAQQPKQETEEELQARRIKQEAMLDDVLPFLRKQKEYDELQVALAQAEIARIEAEVMMGNLSPNMVKGLLGQELMVKDIQARHWMSQYWAGQQAAQDERKKMDSAAKEMEEMEKKAREAWEAMSPEEQVKRQLEAIAEYNKVQEAMKNVDGK